MCNHLRILVIRLGALGDFVQSFGPFEAIRQFHAKDEISLLTTKAFVGLAKRSPWFDHIIVDEKPSRINIFGLWRLKQKIAGFDMVYDLQTSRRSSRYFRLCNTSMWSGIAKGASHPHNNPNRNDMHTLDRQRDQLIRAGIHYFPKPDLNWLTNGVDFSIPQKPYIILAPGSSEHRHEKRWPANYFAQLAQMACKYDLLPLIIGTEQEKKLAKIILEYCPMALDLTGKTSLLELGQLMQKATFVVGNDTGPMHMAALLGKSSVVLFSSASNPDLTAPRGKNVKIVYEPDLKNLSVKKVAQQLNWGH